MKKIITLVITLAVMMPIVASAANKVPIVTVNSNQVTGAVVRDGRLFLPIREVADNLGLEIGWNQATKRATLSSGDSVVELAAGQDVVVNSIAYPYRVFSHKNKLMVPVRVLSLLGVQLEVGSGLISINSAESDRSGGAVSDLPTNKVNQVLINEQSVKFLVKNGITYVSVPELSRTLNFDRIEYGINPVTGVKVLFIENNRLYIKINSKILDCYDYGGGYFHYDRVNKCHFDGQDIYLPLKKLVGIYKIDLRMDGDVIKVDSSNAAVVTDPLYMKGYPEWLFENTEGKLWPIKQ
ncbi:MAG: copper amine oxidase N-terminal domain-containing protein [Peptostreptococcaceae bacterium]|nr:copper amine oxidase N-terminal domain-containing protein [Peptostreptococcaceae bacterium]